MTQPRSAQINDLKAYWSTYTYSGTSGTTFTTLSGSFESSSVTQISGGDTDPVTRGIVTTGTGGYCKLTNATTGASIDSGSPIFGRLTYTGSNYVVTYKTLVSGTETTTALPATYSIKILFPEVMNFGEVPADTFILQLSESPENPGAGSISGDLVVTGNTTLGDATSDTITTNARLASNLNPSTDNNRSLGTSTLRFNNINSESFTARGDNTNTIYTVYDSNSIETSGSSFNIDAAGAINIGNTNATSISISHSGTDVTVDSNLTVSEELEVSGNANFNSEVNIQDNLTVTGTNSLFTGDVNVVGILIAGGLSFTDLVVTGNTTLGDAPSDLVSLYGTTTIQSGSILGTTDTGNINLPNNASARFQIEGTSVDALVTADNLSELVSGGVTSLHSHAGGGGGSVDSVDATYPLSSTGGADPIISIPAASSLTDGYMSIADKNKLDSISFPVSFISDSLDAIVEVIGDSVNLESANVNPITIRDGVGLISLDGTGLLETSSTTTTMDASVGFYINSNLVQITGSSGISLLNNGSWFSTASSSSIEISDSEIFIGGAGNRFDGTSYFRIERTRPTTDIRPPPIHLVASRATSLSSGSTSAANKTGGHIVTELGRAQTTGTDSAGAWFIGIGDPVSNAVNNGLIIGSGGSSGSLGSDSYRPYSTELLRLRQSAANTGQLAFTTSGSVRALNGSLDLTASLGTATVTASSTVTLQSGGAGVINTSSRRIEFNDSSGSENKFIFRYPATVATTDATTTTLFSFTPTATPSQYQVYVSCYDSSLNVHCWQVLIPAIMISGTPTFVGGVAPTPTEVFDSALAGCTLVVDSSGSTIRLRGTGLASTNLTWTISCIEVK